MANFSRIYFYRGTLIGLAYFIIGLCLSIIGPTLPDIMSQTNATTIAQTAIVITSNASGVIIGITLASLCLTLSKSLCALALNLFLCFLTTTTIPFCNSLLVAGLAFFLQGVSLGLIYKGVVNQLYLGWKQRHQMVIIFSIVLAFGAALSPMITSSVVFKSSVQSANRFNASDSNNDVINRQTRDAEYNATINCTDANGTFEYEIYFTNCTNTTGTTFTTLYPNTTVIIQPSSKSETKVTSTTVLAKTKNREPSQQTSSTVSSSDRSTFHYSTQATPQSVQQYWNMVIKTVKELNNVKVAYLLIATFSLLCSLIYLFTCCGLSRKLTNVQQQPPDSVMFTVKSVVASRDNFYVVAASTSLSYLSGSIESIMSNLITVYCMEAYHLPQSRGVLLTGVFWTAIGVSRLTAVLFRRNLDRFGVTFTVNVLTIVALSAMTVFSRNSTVLWLGIAVFGLAFGYSEPASVAYVDQRLNVGPWFVTTWLVAGQCGRATAPLLTVWLMVKAKSNALTIIVLCLTLLFIATGILFRKTISAVNRNSVADQFGEIFAYRHHVDEDETTATELDEYTYFDKTHAVSYFVKSNPLPAFIK